MSEVFISDNHTKNYLCSIIAHSNIDILQPYILNKQKLMYSLSKFLSQQTYDIQFYDPTFPFHNKEELILFLGQSPIKITPGERRMIQDIARKIISFCKSGYDYNKSPYDNLDEVKDDCIKIQNYGDIFCVRNAVTLFNITQDKDNQLECKVSSLIHNQLQLKNQWKKMCVPTLQVKYGKFSVIFD